MSNNNNSPFTTFPAPERTFIPTNPGPPTPRGRGRGNGQPSKRGRKPRGTLMGSAGDSPHVQFAQTPGAGPSTSQSATSLQWTAPTTPRAAGPLPSDTESADGSRGAAEAAGVILPARTPVGLGVGVGAPRPVGAQEEEGEGEDEMLPAMADDEYSTQLSWQSQSKDNLKVLMENLTPEQYERFEAYRRHALPKQAVRKVIQQTVGQQVSQPVAQVVAGIGKVFVGEIVEKAREVQERRGDTGPLSPDHLREAYRMYQQETGRVGAARPLKGKRLFNR